MSIDGCESKPLDCLSYGRVLVRTGEESEEVIYIGKHGIGGDSSVVLQISNSKSFSRVWVQSEPLSLSLCVDIVPPPKVQHIYGQGE